VSIGEGTQQSSRNPKARRERGVESRGGQYRVSCSHAGPYLLTLHTTTILADFRRHHCSLLSTCSGPSSTICDVVYDRVKAFSATRGNCMTSV
jgi:hypothetical protein